jgi:hypothetical protein
MAGLRAHPCSRTDSAGLTHELLDYLHDANIRFSVGMDMTEDVRQAVCEIADGDWVPAISADGERRQKALVAESRWTCPAGPTAPARSAAASALTPAPSCRLSTTTAGATRC